MKTKALWSHAYQPLWFNLIANQIVHVGILQEIFSMFGILVYC